MEKLKNQPDLLNSKYIANARFNGFDLNCGEHNNPLYLAWNSAFVRQMENSLAEFLEDKALGLPYVDWTQPIEKLNNPYVQRIHSWSFGYNPKTGQNTTRKAGKYDNDEHEKRLAEAMSQKAFDDFYPLLESLSNTFQAVMGGSLADESTAAFDPLFLLHRTFIDKVYKEWQDCRLAAGDADWYKAVSGLDKPLNCFKDEKINSDPETLGITMLRMIENRDAACFSYDSLSPC